MSLKQLVTSIDMFGQGIELRINKEVKAKTLIGGVLSIVMILLLGAMFFVSAEDVIYHTNPQVTVEHEIVNPYPQIIINNRTMPIAIGMTGLSNVGTYLPKYFDYKMIYHFGNTSAPELDTEELNLTFCEKDKHFPLVSKEQFESLYMSNNLCTDNQNLTITGAYSESYISYLVLRISICKNITENDAKCAPMEEILQFIDNNPNLFWNIFFMDTSINPQNTTHPVIYTISNFYKAIRYGAYKTSEIFIRKQMLISDDGFIVKTRNFNQSVAFSSYNNDESLFDESRILFDFFIMAGNVNVNYYRNYMKIQAVLASVGGLANVFRILFTLICMMFSLVKRDEIILNKIFEYDIATSNLGLEIPIPKEIVNIKPEQGEQEAKIKYVKSLRSQTNNLSNLNFSISNNEPNSERSKADQQNFDVSNLSLDNKKKKFQFKKINKFNAKIQNPNEEHKVEESVRFEKSYTSQQPIYPVAAAKFEDNIKPDSNGNGDPTLNKLNLIKQKKELRFEFCEIVKGFLCCDCCSNNYIRSKKLLYNKSNFVVEEFLDITFIIQKLDEFDKLKLVLLNEEQLSLFHFIAKELMSLDEDKLKNHNITKYKSIYKDPIEMSKIIQNFKKKINSKVSVGEVDYKLYNLLNDELRIN